MVLVHRCRKVNQWSTTVVISTSCWTGRLIIWCSVGKRLKDAHECNRCPQFLLFANDVFSASNLNDNLAVRILFAGFCWLGFPRVSIHFSVLFTTLYCSLRSGYSQLWPEHNFTLSVLCTISESLSDIMDTISKPNNFGSFVPNIFWFRLEIKSDVPTLGREFQCTYVPLDFSTVGTWRMKPVRL